MAQQVHFPLRPGDIDVNGHKIVSFDNPTVDANNHPIPRFEKGGHVGPKGGTVEKGETVLSKGDPQKAARLALQHIGITPQEIKHLRSFEHQAGTFGPFTTKVLRLAEAAKI